MSPSRLHALGLIDLKGRAIGKEGATRERVPEELDKKVDSAIERQKPDGASAAGLASSMNVVGAPEDIVCANIGTAASNRRTGQDVIYICRPILGPQDV